MLANGFHMSRDGYEYDCFIVYYCGIEENTSNFTKNPDSRGRSFQIGSSASETVPWLQTKRKSTIFPNFLIQGRSWYRRTNPARPPHLSSIDQSDLPRIYYLHAYQLYPDAWYSASWIMKSVAALIASTFCCRFVTAMSNWRW